MFPDVLGELNWARIDMAESLNSTVDISWKTVGVDLNGTFDVDGSQYVIQLEPKTYLDKYSFINFAFYKLKDGKKNYELQLTTKNPGKVLGAIINGTFKKIDEFHYDGIVFYARDNVERRMRFYNNLSNNFVKHFGRVKSNIKTDQGMLTVMLAKTVSKEDTDAVIDQIEKTSK